EDTLPDGEEDHNNGETEEEDSKPIEWDEHTVPDSEGGHNDKKTEQNSSSKIIDKEKPKPQEHQNIITANNVEMPKVQQLNSDQKLSIKPLSTSTPKTEKNNEKLPETGQENKNTPIFGALLAILGATFIFRRQKNKQ
ncbi:LPXTG cell wall anchor domain-containing protein, partial [Staphylococcus sp. HMSC065E08]